MNAPRFASLSGTLLARKGGAKPAMRPRPLSHSAMLDDLGWNDMGDAADPAPVEHVPSSIAALTPAPKPVGLRDEPAAAPAEEEVAPVGPASDIEEPTPVQQQRALAERFGEPEASEPTNLSEAVVTALRAPVAAPARKPKGKAASKPNKDGRKAAFTLRLDADRHLRLRLATALTRHSAQILVTKALDQYLETLPEVGTLARHVPGHAAERS